MALNNKQETRKEEMKKRQSEKRKNERNIENKMKIECNKRKEKKV